MASSYLLYVCCLHSLLAVCVRAIPQNVTVTVRGIGQIVGESQTVVLPDGNQSSIVAFRGIPYAEPPVGELRFAKPRPRRNITSPFKALALGPACPQSHPVEMSEDCLYLNVYVPSAAVHSQVTHNQTELLPVLFWIHGGAFVTGQGNQNLSRLVVVGNIIVVTINYRLGALGFLSTDDQNAPGNFGLWDQRLALQWVKNNIADFRGDPETITVGGDSAGSYSATYQALYAPNQGLFQRIIAASGSAISVGTSKTNAGFYAERLAEKLGCSATGTKEIVICLRQKNVSDIVNTEVDSQAPFHLAWTPAVDGEFLTSDSRDHITWPPSPANLSGLRSVDAIFATTSAEGSVSFGVWVEDMALGLNQSVNEGVTEELFERVIRDVLVSEKQSPDKALIDAVGYEYGAWQNPSDPAARGQGTVDILTDRQWFVPNVVFSRNHAVNNTQAKTYLFQFHLNQKFPWYPWLMGAGHVQYIPYVWGLEDRALKLSREVDRKQWKLSKLLMTYWSNFIKTGDPNRPSQVEEQWPPFTVQDERYLYADSDVISARKHCNAKRTAFWLEYMPKVKHADNGNSGNENHQTPECSVSGAQRPVESFGICTAVIVVVLSMV